MEESVLAVALLGVLAGVAAGWALARSRHDARLRGLTERSTKAETLAEERARQNLELHEAIDKGQADAEVLQGRAR